MRVEDLLIYGKSYCHSNHVKFLLADLLNLNPLELLNHLNDIVDSEKEKLFKKEILALKDGKPLQYVIGNVNFYGNTFLVNENVLIPRFETEELVENTIRYAKEIFNGKAKILDIGCGSGVIGLTLKQKLPDSSVDLLDISKEALEVTRKNAESLGLDVNIIESDLFENINSKYDIIISNPPYIREDEEIEDIVKNNEPHLALYGGIDGLDYYRRILKDIEKHLNIPGLIAFEIGYLQKDDITNIVNSNLKNVVIEAKKDLSLKDRMIFILKSE